MTHARAALLLMIHALFWLLGTPGLDFLPVKIYTIAKDRNELVERVSLPVAKVAFAIADFNREIRTPLADSLGAVQRPFRISQQWHLYRDGPGKLERMEIYLDDALVYRSVDSEYRWLEPQLRNRRVRPMVESTVQRRRSPNWEGLSRFIVSKALAERPDVKKVELRCLHGSFPGHDLKEDHSVVATAPDWKPVEI